MRMEAIVSFVLLSLLLAPNLPMSARASSGAANASFNAFNAYDAGTTAGLPCKGYSGAVFDGRYVYFVPYNDGSNFHGRVLRYDAEGSFTDSASWSAYDAGSTGGLSTKGYSGAVFDGRYIFFVPYSDAMGVNFHGRVLRYDVHGSFTDSASWSAYDAGSTGGLNTKGYSGAVFDGRYVYFVPYNDGTNFHGRVLRYDAQAPFLSSTSWNAYDAGTTSGLVCKGYLGGAFDGRYVYFVPYNDGSGAHGKVLRYDVHGSFTDSASWNAYDAGSTGGLNTKGYSGAVFDGRYVYFAPFHDDSDAHGRAIRYDARTRDVAVTNVVSSRTVIAQGYSLNIDFTVENQGDNTETFNVTTYANETMIATLTNITLTSGNTTTLTFMWSTTSFGRGNYTISVYAWPLLGEIDTANNNYTTDLITVTIPGDVTGDVWVDMQDISIIIDWFMTTPPTWNPNCDVNGDLTIDMADISIAIDNFMQT